jgi:uncharacterized BrkB/YihY/UPF0761 family membrane protein
VSHETDPLFVGTDPDGRIARLRARAEQATVRYQERATTQPLLALPVVLLARYVARQGMLLASAAAFRLFLWLLPLALLSAGILAHLSTQDGDSIETAARTAGVTGAASREVVDALHEGDRSWWVAVLIGAVLFLWTTRTLMRNLTVVNAHLWAVPIPRRRQKDVLLTTLLFAGGWIVMILISGFSARLDHVFVGGVILAAVLQALAASAIWLYICRRMPDGRADLLDLVPGSLVFGVGLAIMNVVSRVYLPARFEHSSALYGSLGVAGVILAWLLLTGQLIVGSILINTVWSDYRRDGWPPPAAARR